MPDLREHLQNLFGLDDFRPAQRGVIEDVLAGKDVLCVMPTGAGKSLCYQLPTSVQRGLTVVVSPLISLMADQVQQMRDEGLPAMLINSSQTAGSSGRRSRSCIAGLRVCCMSRRSDSPLAILRRIWKRLSRNFSPWMRRLHQPVGA